MPRGGRGALGSRGSGDQNMEMAAGGAGMEENARDDVAASPGKRRSKARQDGGNDEPARNRWREDIDATRALEALRASGGAATTFLPSHAERHQMGNSSEPARPVETSRREESNAQASGTGSGETGREMPAGPPGSETQAKVNRKEESAPIVQDGAPSSSAPPTSTNGATMMGGGAGDAVRPTNLLNHPERLDRGEPLANFSETSGTTYAARTKREHQLLFGTTGQRLNAVEATSDKLWKTCQKFEEVCIREVQTLKETDGVYFREMHALHAGHHGALAKIGEIEAALSLLWSCTSSSVQALDAARGNSAEILGRVELDSATGRGEIRELWLRLQNALGEATASMAKSSREHDTLLIKVEEQERVIQGLVQASDVSARSSCNYKDTVETLLIKVDAQDGVIQRLAKAYDTSYAPARSGSAYNDRVEKLLSTAGAQAVEIQQLKAQAYDTSQVAARNGKDYIDMAGKVEKQGRMIQQLQTQLQTQVQDASGVSDLGDKVRAFEEQLRHQKAGAKVVNSLAQQKATSCAKTVNGLAQQLAVLTQWVQGSNALGQEGMPARAAAETQAMSSRAMARISKPRRRVSSERSRATQPATRLLKMYIKSRKAPSPPAGRIHVYNQGASSTMTSAAPATTSTTSPAAGVTDLSTLDHDLPGDHATFSPPAPPTSATPEQEAPTCVKSGGRACPTTLTNLGAQAQISGSPSLASLANLFQRTLVTSMQGLAKGPDHAPQAVFAGRRLSSQTIFAEAVLTRVLVDVLKNIGDLEKCAWWKCVDEADFVYQDLQHEMDTMHNLGFDTVTVAVFRKAIATIFFELGVGGAPLLAAIPEETEAPNSEPEDANSLESPAPEGGKDGAGDIASTVAAKATTPANECAGVNVETKAPAPNKEGASLKDATDGPPPNEQLEPMEHVEPVLDKGEYIIKVPGDGDCMFEATATGIEAIHGRVRPVSKALRLALANDCRDKAVKQMTGVMRAHLEEAIKQHLLFLDGVGGKEITNIDAHATEMGKQGVFGGEIELLAIAAGNHLVIKIIRGEQRHSIQLEGQEIRNPSITLAFYGNHYDLVVDTRTDMGRTMADTDLAEVTWSPPPRSTVDADDDASKEGGAAMGNESGSVKDSPAALNKEGGTVKGKENTSAKGSFRDACKGAASNAYAVLGEDAEDGQDADDQGQQGGQDAQEEQKAPDQGLKEEDEKIKLLSARLDALDQTVVASPQDVEAAAALWQECAALANNCTVQRLQSEFIGARAERTCNRMLKKCREALATIGPTPYLTITDASVERDLDLPNSPTLQEAAPRIRANLEELLPSGTPWAARLVNADELLHLHQTFADTHRLMQSCVSDHGLEAREIRHPLEVGMDSAEASLNLLRSRFAATLTKVDTILSGEADGFQQVPDRKGKSKKMNTRDHAEEAGALVRGVWDMQRADAGEIKALLCGRGKGGRAVRVEGAQQAHAGKQCTAHHGREFKASTPHGNGK
jgi:hypothetical protein